MITKSKITTKLNQRLNQKQGITSLKKGRIKKDNLLINYVTYLINLVLEFK